MSAGRLTDGFVVCGIKGPERWPKWTFHLHLHHVVFIVSLQHCCKTTESEYESKYKVCTAIWFGLLRGLAVVVRAEPLRRAPVASCEPAASVCCPTPSLLPIWLQWTHTHTHLYGVYSHLSSNTHKYFTQTFHTLALTVEWDVGWMPNALHYPSCTGFSNYLHRWRCRCCWRLFCTGPERALCGGGGRSADPTETQTKDHDTLFHLYQLNLLHI